MATIRTETTEPDRTLGQDAWAAVAALLALLLLIPLAVFTPWLVVLGAPVVVGARWWSSRSNEPPLTAKGRTPIGSGPSAPVVGDWPAR